MAVDVTEAIPEVAPVEGRRRPSLLKWGLWALVAVPVLIALAEAIRSPKLHFWDYWVVIAKSVDKSGELTDGVWRLHNEHPAVLASLAFWADAKYFNGYNYVLGVFCVLMSIVMLFALIRMLPARLTGLPRAAVAVAVSFLVFSSSALEYYGIGMSGTHWLLGLMPSVVAISFAHHGWTVPALVFALIGSFGHGSAYPVWFTLALIAFLRRDHWWRIVTPVVLGAGVMIHWMTQEHPVAPTIQLVGADTYLATALTMLGEAWVSRAIDLASMVGAVIVVLYGIFTVRAVKERQEPQTPRIDYSGWIGLGVHTVLVAALIGFGRARFSVNEGLAPRFAMVSLLAASAVVVLLAVLGPRFLRTRIIPFALVVGIGTFAVGTYQAGATRSYYPKQPVLAVAMHLEAKSVMLKMSATPMSLAPMRALKAYPFTDDFTLGCHGPELGTTVDLKTAKDLPAPKFESGSTMGAVETGEVRGDTEITGWAQVNAKSVDCVFITDQTGLVVGGGAVGLPRPDVREVISNGSGRSGWAAVAKPGTKDLIVLVSAEGQLYRIVTVI
ncbi:hypothetical protein [Lentzea roselyniae]|uniref:hypothetical protein n=1 Tax=Lentzea roselyniae TaxID=531940 RepID=UPI0031F85A56